MTETDISKELKLPISTVHYNLSVLVKAKLVEAREFHYSEKGREVNHYSLANKLIIIAPSKMDDSTKDKLKNLFLSIGFGLLFAGTTIFSLLQKPFSYFGLKSTTLQNSVMQESSKAAYYAAPDVIIRSGSTITATAAPEAAKMAADEVTLNAGTIGSSSVPFWSFSHAYMWIVAGIIIGGCLTISVLYLVKFIRAKSVSKK